MEADDAAAWNFYASSATMFVKDFGLMAMLIAATELDGVARSIFLEKLSMIHSTIAKKSEDVTRERAAGTRPEIVIKGSDNG